MLAVYQQLFTALLESQVEYCVWKNIQEVPEALAGIGDIDLYISPASHTHFVGILRDQGFTRLISHKGTPCVEHYYGYDAQSGKFCHLHCYFRIVTGESHIKQYVIPIEDCLSVFPNTKNSSGVSEMHPVLQSRLNFFRRAIKLSCLPGALLFFSERRGYRHERFLLENALRDSPETDRKIREAGWLAKIQAPSSLPEEILAGIRYRFYFRHWSRFPAFVTPFYRYGTIILRLAGKMRRRRKMLPLGSIIAVTGGSMDEKARMEDQIAEWLGLHFDIVTVDDSLRLFRQENATPDKVGPENIGGILPAMTLVWRSLVRHRRLKLALRQAMAGSIVIWRGQYPESITKPIESLADAKAAQTAVTMTLLRISSALLGADPDIDILLRLTSRSTAEVGEDNLSTAPGTARRPESMEPPAPVGHSAQMSINKFVDTNDQAWKHELWQALVALQP